MRSTTGAGHRPFATAPAGLFRDADLDYSLGLRVEQTDGDDVAAQQVVFENDANLGVVVIESKWSEARNDSHRVRLAVDALH